jgi:nucleoside-diphosphate-sugar epimerase
MKVLVAGATGVIGRQLVPLLTEAGHDVVAVARTHERADLIRHELITVDAMDRWAVSKLVRRMAPGAIVNLLTAIPARMDPKRFDEQMAKTNRLRQYATANLLAAAGDARIISEGLAFGYSPRGGSPADEDRPLWVNGPKPFRPVVAALRSAERQTLRAGGTVLRIGHLYGPGTVFAGDGSLVAQLRARQMPIVGQGESVFSFIHARDAASAFVAALETGQAGTFNVVDDHPAPVHQWLPALAQVVGAPPPRRVPTVAARVFAGAWGVAYMTKLVGADNARARRALRWQPQHRSWRDGFADEHSHASSNELTLVDDAATER